MSSPIGCSLASNISSRRPPHQCHRSQEDQSVVQDDGIKLSSAGAFDDVQLQPYVSSRRLSASRVGGGVGIVKSLSCIDPLREVIELGISEFKGELPLLVRKD